MNKSTERKKAQSALYFLVWHAGLDMKSAAKLLVDYPEMINGCGRAGSRAYKNAAAALKSYINRIEIAARIKRRVIGNLYNGHQK